MQSSESLGLDIEVVQDLEVIGDKADRAEEDVASAAPLDGGERPGLATAHPATSGAPWRVPRISPGPGCRKVSSGRSGLATAPLPPDKITMADPP